MAWSFKWWNTWKFRSQDFLTIMLPIILFNKFPKLISWYWRILRGESKIPRDWIPLIYWMVPCCSLNCIVHYCILEFEHKKILSLFEIFHPRPRRRKVIGYVSGWGWPELNICNIIRVRSVRTINPWPVDTLKVCLLICLFRF